MKKITILVVMGSLCLNFSAKGQKTFRPAKTLHIGDTIPDIEFTNVINYRSPTIRLSDFKNKLVILDFWATWCSPCIRSLPKNFELQKKHPADLFFLLLNPKISRDKPERIKKFLDERRSIFNFPTLVGDTLITKLLNIHTMGTYVWIKNNVVTAITLSEDVTESNIQKMLAGDSELHVAPKYVFNYQVPLFYGDNGGKQQQPYLFRSLLLPYAEGYHGDGYDQDSSGKVSRIGKYNISAINLIVESNKGYERYRFGHLKLMVKDPDKLLGGDNSRASNARNRLNYEAIFPKVSKEQAWEYYRDDIKRYLPYDCDTVRIKDSCWVLKLRPNARLKVASGKAETNLDELNGLPIYYRNQTLISLVMAMKEEYQIPVYDETGYEGNVDLLLPPYLKDTKAMIRSLHKQGFDLSKELRESTYLIIRDRKSFTN